MRFLLVEDAIEIRLPVQLLLEVEGHDAAGVADCENALRLMKEEDYGFDVVLLDLTMGGMSAQEFVRKLDRALNGRARPLIGVLSGSTRSEEVAREIQADFWILKPYTVDQILAHLRKSA